jgi:hypothetical protein
VWGCTYGAERKSVATAARPNQHTKKKGCKAMVRFSCRGNKESRNTCVLTGFIEEHNHMRSKEMFEQDIHKIEEDEEVESLKDALKMNAKAGQIRNFMRLKFNKTGITTKHVRYMMGKSAGPNTEEGDLATFLEKVEEEGGKVDAKLDELGRVRVLGVQTAEMRRAYLGVSPDVVSVDTTFNFESAGFIPLFNNSVCFK